MRVNAPLDRLPRLVVHCRNRGEARGDISGHGSSGQDAGKPSGRDSRPRIGRPFARTLSDRAPRGAENAVRFRLASLRAALSPQFRGTELAIAPRLASLGRRLCRRIVRKRGEPGCTFDRRHVSARLCRRQPGGLRIGQRDVRCRTGARRGSAERPRRRRPWRHPADRTRRRRNLSREIATARRRGAAGTPLPALPCRFGGACRRNARPIRRGRCGGLSFHAVGLQRAGHRSGRPLRRLGVAKLNAPRRTFLRVPAVLRRRATFPMPAAIRRIFMGGTSRVCMRCRSKSIVTCISTRRMSSADGISPISKQS